MSTSPNVRARRLTLSTIAVIGGLALSPAAAFAGAGLSASPTFDSAMQPVGTTDRGGTIIITNGNINDPGQPPEGSATVCRNDDDPAVLPACAGAEGIVLTPSCGALTPLGPCRPAGADPDVFRLTPTATGVAGTACAGVAFSVVRVPGEFGKFRFDPPVNTHVVLPVNGSSCTIRFTFDVLRIPTLDSAARPGIQTDQVVEVTSQSGAGNLGAGQGTRRGTTTVIRATASSIDTTASPNTITLGAGTLGDSATVSGRVNPVAGATIDFRLYAPEDTNCTGTPVFESLNVPYPVAGGQVNSARYTPTAVGTYRWRAFYSGDANNDPVAGSCNAANENAIVNAVVVPPPPSAEQVAPNEIAAPAAPSAVVPPASVTTVCTPPPAKAPSGAAPNTPTPQTTKFCARGVATITGPAGCVGTPFRAVVRGTQIARVVFTLDGKVVRRLTKPNSGSVYVLPINPRKLRPGVHRVVATVTFLEKSGARAKVQRVTFSRCKRAVAAPAFTG